MTELTNDWAWKIIAEECNVKSISVGERVVYSEPLLKDKYKEKQRQFDEIYNEQSWKVSNED